MKTELAIAVIAGGGIAMADKVTPVTLSFDADTIDQEPRGLELARTGEGKPGRWIIRAENDAPSGKNVLAQVDTDATDYRFPIAFTGPELKDLRLSVKCKPASGKLDQACGLVFRLKDPDNYYVVRANALENNVRAYHVVNGKRVQFAGWNGKVKGGVWHDLAIDVVGEHLLVTFNGKQVIDARDRTFSQAGKFGVWTKADSVTYFDDLVAIPK